MTIDNEMYFREDIDWWNEDPDSHHVLLRYCLNPVRFGYFQKVMRDNPAAAERKTVIDIGCGGGFLTEEFAKAGFIVTGIEPSPVLVRAAREHAAAGALGITYLEGRGESLPFGDGSCDVVSCCDVLEHVDDLAKVISEISRVLKPGGLFFFDTINRNLLSKLMVIKIAQEWKFTAWEAPRTHVYDMFVKPAELDSLLKQNGMSLRQCRGLSPTASILTLMRAVRQRARGRITRREMGERMKFGESDELLASYMGFGVKN